MVNKLVKTAAGAKGAFGGAASSEKKKEAQATQFVHEMDLAKMSEFMADAAFTEISAILKIDPTTMEMRTFAAM